jgi:sec-independent protein translocase protein TatA
MPELLPNLTLAFGWPGGPEWIVLLVLGLLIFGKRLPEVGRSIGRGIVEFNRGIKGIEDDVDDESDKPAHKLTEKERHDLPSNDVTEKSTASAEHVSRQG